MAYTVSQYNLSGKESVSFNIRFVVVIATPGDEDIMHETNNEGDGHLGADADSNTD